MRCALFGIVVSCSAAIALAQAPEAGGFNQGGPGPGGPGGPRMMMGPPPNAMFSAIDVDGDGTINKTELRKAIVALKKLDTDGDGIITLAEVSPMGGPMGDPTQMIDRLMQGDKDGDGLLTAEELPGRMGARMIQDGDTSGDGALDRDELTAAMERARNQFRGGPGGFQNGQGGPGGFQGGPGGFRAGAGGANFDPAQMTGQIIQQYDKNGDNVLSADEVPRDARGKVKDLNGDGVIEAGELQAFTEQMGERMRANMGRARGRQNQNGAQPGSPGTRPNNP